MRCILLFTLGLVLNRSALCQVNIQSGAAQQSFPLINFSDAKTGLATSVTASYSSGNGLIVNSIASNLGTGWSLDAGGVVTRMQIGEPDDQQAYFNGNLGQVGSEDALDSYPNGYMYNPNTKLGCQKLLAHYPVFKQRNTVFKQRNEALADTEQDKFIFQANGRYGAFVIGSDQKVYPIGDTRVKISFALDNLTTFGIRTRIKSFTITTEDGVIYRFTKLGLAHLCRYKNSRMTANGFEFAGAPSDNEGAVNRHWGYPVPASKRPWIVSNWYLTEIENPNTGGKITFEYDEIRTEASNTKYVTHQRKLEGFLIGLNLYKMLSNDNIAHQASWTPDNELLRMTKPGAINITYIRSINQTQRLRRILLPNSGYIQINYQQKVRVDLKGDNAVHSVYYYLNNKVLRGYEFETGYFLRKGIVNYDHPFIGVESKFARLCLLSIKKIGNGEDQASEPPVRFEYYTGTDTNSPDDIVPPANSLAQDHWGYYNGSNSSLPMHEDHDFLSAPYHQYFRITFGKYHETKGKYAQNGLLRKVIYPTGGELSYGYLANSVQASPNTTQNISSGGVSVLTTYLVKDGDYAKAINTVYQYTLANNQTSSRWGYERPHYYSLSKTVYDEDWTIRHAGISYPEMATSINADFWGKAIVGTLVGVGFQLAISAIPIASLVTAINVAMAAFSIINFIVSMTSNHYFYSFILSNTNNILSNPLGQFSSRVQVWTNDQAGGTSSGRTVYDFSDRTFQKLLVPTMEWPFLNQPRMLGWAYGLPRRVTMYDKDNKKVSEKINEYQLTKEKLADQFNINCKCASKASYSLHSDRWKENRIVPLGLWFNQALNYMYIPAGQTYEELTPRFYSYYTGRTDLKSTVERSYRNGSEIFKTDAVFVTDPATLLQKSTITRNDPRYATQQISYYPNDFKNVPGPIQTLISRNALHTPIATETWALVPQVLYIGGSPMPVMTASKLLDASIIEYKSYTFNAGTSQQRIEVKPWRTHKLKAKEPIPAIVYGNHRNDVLIRNPSLFKVTEEYTYDNDGNLIQTLKDDQVTSYVLDYKDRYVVASVSNAAYEDVAYTSFETDNSGRWTKSASIGLAALNWYSNEGLTGNRSFVLFNSGPLSTNLSTSINSNKSYTLTYWSKSSTPLNVYAGGLNFSGRLNIGTMIAAGPNGWYLHQHEISESAWVLIAGPGLVDEIRLYPKEAMMTTVCYKEGIGKTVECDANNRLVFYEYDGLGRLKLVRDGSKNVVKTYEYNYKQ
jgi:hypothetical protein